MDLENRKYGWNLWLLALLANGGLCRLLNGRFNWRQGEPVMEESGSSAAEYAILICGIALAILVLLQQVGSQINRMYLYVVDTLSSVH